jgi:hypothetical protein
MEHLYETEIVNYERYPVHSATSSCNNLAAITEVYHKLAHILMARLWEIEIVQL